MAFQTLQQGQQNYAAGIVLSYLHPLKEKLHPETW